MFRRSLMRGCTLTNVSSQPRDLAEMYVAQMTPRPALSTEWTALRSASKSLCWDAKFLTSDLKWLAVSSVMRPRQTRVRVPPSETVCSIINLQCGEKTACFSMVSPILLSKLPATTCRAPSNIKRTRAQKRIIGARRPVIHVTNNQVRYSDDRGTVANFGAVIPSAARSASACLSDVRLQKIEHSTLAQIFRVSFRVLRGGKHPMRGERDELKYLSAETTGDTPSE